MNKTEILEHQIVSASVHTFIYAIPLEKVQQHICCLCLSQKKISNNVLVRVCYLVIIQQISQFIKIQNKLNALPTYKQFNASLIPFTNRQQIMQHIKMMQKMNENQFQSQYIEMLDLLEKDIEIGIIRDFCRKQFQWSQAKTNKFIQNQEINNINKFLHYRGFNQLEIVKIRSIWQFLDTYLHNKYDQ